MCVILCCEDQFPTYEILKDAEMMNPHGGGISWVEGNKIKFKKGLKAKTINKMIRKGQVSLPCIIHFRIASVGAVHPKLTHPFPIERDVPLKMEGITEATLFHNGTVYDWEGFALSSLKGEKNINIPDGLMSDSRALAWVSSVKGYEFMNRVTGWNKIAILTKEGIKRFGSNWADYKGVHCSNDYFINDPSVQTTPMAIRYEEDTLDGDWIDTHKDLIDDPLYMELVSEFGYEHEEIDTFINQGLSLQDIKDNAIMEYQELQGRFKMSDEEVRYLKGRMRPTFGINLEDQE